LTGLSSLAGISFAIPDSELEVIKVDGGLPVAKRHATVSSVGILYPAERVDFVLSWPESSADRETEIIIALDKE
jgi:hypothetical protein